MALNIVDAVATIKQSVAQCLTAQAIHQACREARHTWGERELGPAQTIWAFVLQVLHGNTACACRSVGAAGLLGGGLLQRPSAAAAGGLRAPLGTHVPRRAALVSRAAMARTSHLLHGRQRLLDARYQTAARALRPAGDAASPAAAFRSAHFLTMFDAASGLLVKMLAAPLRTHDLAQVAQLHPELQPGDVLVGDTAFAAFVHLALLFAARLHGVFRADQRTLVSFRRDRQLVGKRPQGTRAAHAVSRLGAQAGTLRPNRPVPPAARLPAVDDGRAIRRAARNDRGARATLWDATVRLSHARRHPGHPLLDAQAYPADELAALYGRRWEIETNFRHLKTTMRMDVLHCHSVEGVLKELCMFALVYNLVRLVMLAAAREQQLPHQRLSFIDALRWLASACKHTTELELLVNPAAQGATNHVSSNAARSSID